MRGAGNIRHHRSKRPAKCATDRFRPNNSILPSGRHVLKWKPDQCPRTSTPFPFKPEPIRIGTFTNWLL